MGAPKGVPHNKPSKEEQKEIQKYVYDLLFNKAMHAGEIKDLVSSKYKKSKRSVEPYISRARAKMREESGKDKEDLRAESYHFYYKIANDPAASHKDRLKARERIDKLLALDIPVTDTSRNVNLNLTPEELQSMTDEEFEQHYSNLSRIG